MDIGLIVAIYGAVIATVLGVLRLLEYRRDSPRLSLRLATAIISGPAERRFGTDHLVTLTVANSGRQAIGVSSMGLSLTDRRYVPFIEPMPGETALPAVLQTGQSTSYWLRRDEFLATLQRERVGVSSALAHLTDGKTFHQSVEPSWRA